MSGEPSNFSEDTSKPAREAFVEAGRYFPRDWVEDSDDAGAMIAKISDERGHYSHFRQVPVAATHPTRGLDVAFGYRSRPEPEITASKREVRMAGASPTLATSIHELSHRMEFTAGASDSTGGPTAKRGSIPELEHAFLERRWREAGTDDQPPSPLYPGTARSKEVGRDGGFVSPYVGKVYAYSSSTEVLSMGAESVFAGKNGALIGLGSSPADLDHRDFVLGVFAAFGRRP